MPEVTSQAIAIEPLDNPFFADAVVRGGGQPTELTASSTALVWGRPHDYRGLASALAAAPHLRWVQLPSAGVDDYHGAGLLGEQIQWTSAKGAYAAPVAEHALALTLALLRELPRRARATHWGTQAGLSLHGLRVLVVGAGGIAEEYARLVALFSVHLTVCRRGSSAASFAHATIGFDELSAHIGAADVVVLAAPLTAQTTGMISDDLLRRMKPTAILVNVARGGLVDTDALTAALARGEIAGAALDVTDPEPLPEEHPLWAEPRALITPHSADTWEMIQPLLAGRISENVALYCAGEPLVGVVDPATGY